ncbi:MAG: hypothetical protein M1484_03110 [Patescibacteria group bacterium]|nr:hypothetical protein [Patescibacteria group bacterium]MCL5432053.1 hypothetical protein [Patescibacteria group bacterium]
MAKFLSEHDSPLVYFANDFVQQADRYGLDYRLLVAISGVESTFGKQYVAGTFNAYGWGQGTFPFASWPDGIAAVSQGLRQNYVDKGAKTLNQISYIYCPPSNLSWAAKVQRFMDQIDAEQVGDSYVPALASVTPKLSLTL